jgi:aryl-alcohol dehydrogenase-like predicted oxidoreductase
MQSTLLGKTSLQVTRMGLGLAALGRPGYINLGHAADLQKDHTVDGMRSHAHQVMDHAWRSGIRYFDAARSYGRAEQFLGSWLTQTKKPIDQLVVGSKWGYTYTAEWQIDADVHEVKEHTGPVLQRQLQESLTHLNGYLRLYQIHSATLDSGVLSNKNVLTRLSTLKDDGILIGLTLSGVRQPETLQKAMSVKIDGRTLFDSVQATWNLLERSCGPVLQEANSNGMGVIIKEGLANGRLTSKNQEADFFEKRRTLEGVASQLNCAIDTLALAAILAQPWVDIVLSGAATSAQLRSNVRAMQIHLDDSLPSELDAVQEDADIYWQKRSQLPWN